MLLRKSVSSWKHIKYKEEQGLLRGDETNPKDRAGSSFLSFSQIEKITALTEFLKD